MPDELVLVKMLVQYPSFAVTMEETSYHEFIDVAPEFRISNKLLEAYLQIAGVQVRLCHLDPPSSIAPRATHLVSQRPQ